MGYACPVCGNEQPDGVHLANHLAVTASLGREDHLEWLEEHAPDWADCNQQELADRVVEYAPEVERPAFEGEGEGHAHAHDHDRPFEAELARQTQGQGRGSMTTHGPGGPMTDDTEAILEEARELTRRMYEDGDDADADTDAATDADGDGDDNA